VENILNKARNSIGRFCYSECMAYCCRKGTLKVTKEEAKLIAGDSFEALLKEGRLHEINDKKLYFIDLNRGCPALEGSKCTLHNNPKRPAICRDFPIFVNENKVQIDPKCYAVMKGMLYPYTSWIKRKGYFLERLPSNQ